MKVKIPKKRELVKFFDEILFKRVKEDDDRITYEAPVGVTLRYRAFEVPDGKKDEFFRQIEVKGGFKRKYGDRIEIRPPRDEGIFVRVSSGMRELIDKYLEEHEDTLSNFVRMCIHEEIFKWLRAKRRSKDSRKRREWKAKEQDRKEERMYG